jgi:hypothetical protein
MTKQFWNQLCETERNLLKLEAIDPNPFEPEVSRLLVKVQFEMRMAPKPWTKSSRPSPRNFGNQGSDEMGLNCR